MTIFYVDGTYEQSAWYTPICRVNKFGNPITPLGVGDFSKIKRIFRGGIKEKQHKINS